MSATTKRNHGSCALAVAVVAVAVLVTSVEVTGKPHTTTAYVGLGIAASDGGGTMKARVRDNGSEWSGWKEFLTHLSHRRGEGDGEHSLEVQICDNAGNVSADVVSDSVTLELVPSLREHRNLYNGDFGIFFWNAEMWQPEGGRYTAKAIHRFVDRLADNGVDTFVINPNSQVAWYPSKVIPTIMDRYVRDDPSVPASNWWCHDLLNPALDLKEAGVDPLAEAIRQCRRRGISSWVSVRMNDPHLHHPYLQCPLYKDPKYRLNGLLNYEQREVRDYYFALIRELVNDYDIDGLELDWLRCPTCCRRDASAETIGMMTNWFGEIRQLTQVKAARRGKPLYFGMRIPANHRLLPKIGIDVQGMARQGMLDFLCPSNFMQTTWDMPHDELQKVFGKSVAIYGVTELWTNETMVWSEKLQRQIAPYNNASPPALRGNAAGKLVLGADGIVQYNFFCGDQSRKYDKVPGVRSVYSGLQGLHDLESLHGQTKHYSLCCNLRNYGPYEFGLPMPLPVTLKPNERKAFRLPMCAEPNDAGLKLIVQVVVEKTDADARMTVNFNKSKPHADGEPTDQLLFPMGPANRHLPEYQAFNYRFDPNEIIEGWNEITLTNSGNQSTQIVSIELAIASSASIISASEKAKRIVLPARGVCAHRGAMATHPENTIAALKEALRLGVHAVEFDVHWTKDRQLVLMHDSTVDRTTNGTGKVSDYTLAEIRHLDAGSWKGEQFAGERVPTLEETLKMMPENIWLFIDIQFRPHLAAPVTREVVRHNRRHQCMLLVVSHEAAKAARQVDSGVFVSSMNQPGYDAENVTDVIARGYNALRITGIGPPENMRRLKEANLRILFWSSAKPWPSLKQLFDAGIDFPVANDPREMLRAVQKLGIEPWKPVYRREE